MPPSADSRPRLARGCRLDDPAGGEATLLMPERAMKLNGPGLEIVRRCDGQRTVAAIVLELAASYPNAPAAAIEQDAMQFLTRLWEKRAIDLE
jgi:pyrroloquinoline quinone biosynthesis protein D